MCLQQFKEHGRSLTSTAPSPDLEHQRNEHYRLAIDFATEVLQRIYPSWRDPANFIDTDWGDASKILKRCALCPSIINFIWQLFRKAGPWTSPTKSSAGKLVGGLIGDCVFGSIHSPQNTSIFRKHYILSLLQSWQLMTYDLRHGNLSCLNIQVALHIETYICSRGEACV